MGKCEICGAPSGYYPLCKNCNDEKEKGIVYKDEKTGQWKKKQTTKNEQQISTKNESIANEETHEKCIICGALSNGKPLCRECYYDTVDREDEIDKNAKAYELREYYYNLRSNIYRMTNYDYIKANCKKLIGLAWITRDIHKDTSLSDRVIEDVEEILKKKKPKEEIIEEQPENPKDSQKAAIYRTDDGHVVKSIGEREIDDILYHAGFCHAYEKIVDEIPAHERAVKADFFIPTGTGKGVYIEFWGMDTLDYKKNKTEKKELYEKYNIPLIEVEKGDIDDRTLLASRIKREFYQYAEGDSKTETAKPTKSGFGLFKKH